MSNHFRMVFGVSETRMSIWKWSWAHERRWKTSSDATVSTQNKKKNWSIRHWKLYWTFFVTQSQTIINMYISSHSLTFVIRNLSGSLSLQLPRLLLFFLPRLFSVRQRRWGAFFNETSWVLSWTTSFRHGQLWSWELMMMINQMAESELTEP